MVGRLIVTFADAQAATAARSNVKLSPYYGAALSDAAGTPLHVKRAMVGGAMGCSRSPAPSTSPPRRRSPQARSLRDRPLRIARLPDPPQQSAQRPVYLHDDQWYLLDVAGNPYDGIDVGHAWDITTGSASMVIAVVDSGIVAHPDLTGRVLPGYDFVTDVTSANDGDGRDPDATDPGDWRTDGLCPAPFDKAEDSNWHGTLVAGILAANSNNGDRHGRNRLERADPSGPRARSLRRIILRHPRRR